MAKNQVENGRLVREATVRGRCEECVWYRAVDVRAGVCREQQSPLHATAQETCPRWMSHSQLKEIFAKIKDEAVKARATLDFGAGAVPADEVIRGVEPPIGTVVEELTEEDRRRDPAQVLTDHNLLDINAMGRVIAHARHNVMGEETRE